MENKIIEIDNVKYILTPVEKKVEKDYEIQSFRFTDVAAYPGSIWDRNTKGEFGPIGDNHWATEKSMLDSIANKEIYSVKRLSDGEVFTVGDKIDNFQGKPLLKKINLGSDNTIWLDCTIVRNYSTVLAYARKFKEKPVLFTTEDGVDVREGDTVTYVNYLLSLFTVCWYKNSQVKEGMKVFSSEEKARHYIKLSEKKYSALDIKELLDHPDTKGWGEIKNYKNIILSKLGI